MDGLVGWEVEIHIYPVLLLTQGGWRLRLGFVVGFDWIELDQNLKKGSGCILFSSTWVLYILLLPANFPFWHQNHVNHPTQTQLFSISEEQELESSA